MSRKILVDESELNSIVDAINNRADYLDDMNGDTSVSTSMRTKEDGSRQMQTKDLSDNIMKMEINLSDYYTKSEIDQLIQDGKLKIRFGYLPNTGSENTFYFIDKFDQQNTNILDLSVYIWDAVNAEYKCVSDLKLDFKEIIKQNQRTFDKSDPITLDIDSENNKLTIGLNPSKLRGVTQNTSDSSTKVATTEFVHNLIEGSDSGKIVKWQLIDDSGYDDISDDTTDRENGVIYLYPKLDMVYFGDSELGGTNRWKILDELFYLLYVKYTSDIPSQSSTPNSIPGVDDIVESLNKNNYTKLNKYEKLFGDPWMGSSSIEWTLNYSGTWYPDESHKSIKGICSDLQIPLDENTGTEIAPLVTASPKSFPKVPWYGWSVDNGTAITDRDVEDENRGVISKKASVSDYDNVYDSETIKDEYDFLDTIELMNDGSFVVDFNSGELENPDNQIIRQGYILDIFSSEQNVNPNEQVDFIPNSPHVVSTEEAESPSIIIDIDEKNVDITSIQVNLEYNGEFVEDISSNYEYDDSTHELTVYPSSAGQSGFTEGDEIRYWSEKILTLPHSVPIDLSWKGTLYPVWEEEKYTENSVQTNIADIWNNYSNVPCTDIITPPTGYTQYLKFFYDDSEDEYDEIKFRLAIIPVAEGSYDAHSDYIVSSLGSINIGIYDEQRDFSEDPTALSEYLNLINSNAYDIVHDPNYSDWHDDEDWTTEDNIHYYEISDDGQDILHNNITCFYIQKYYLDEDDQVVVLEEGSIYVKNFTTSSGLVYDIEDIFVRNNEGEDE